MSRKITLMIVPEGGDRVYSRSLPSNLLKVLFVLVCLLLIFMVSISAIYAKLVYKAARSAMLEDENKRLREYFTRVVDIEKSFKKNQELTARLAEMAGVNLADLRGPAQINFDSLGAAAVDSQAEPAQPQASLTGMTPEQLAQQTVPSGRPLYGWITRPFLSDSTGTHSGIDFAVREGTSVLATASGMVVSAGWDNDLGYMVVIDHQNGYITSYGHNKKILVEKGERILKGDVVALSGNTGNSTAPHLHYEIIKDGVAVDPTPYLD